jgi:hypothetical protein
MVLAASVDDRLDSVVARPFRLLFTQISKRYLAGKFTDSVLDYVQRFIGGLWNGVCVCTV